MERNSTEGVSWCMNNLQRNVSHLDVIAVIHNNVWIGRLFSPVHPEERKRCEHNEFRIIPVDDNLRVRLGFHLRIPCHVVHMPMCIDNVFDPDVVLFRFCDYAIHIGRRIYNQAFACFRVAHNIGEYGHMTNLNLVQIHTWHS